MSDAKELLKDIKWNLKNYKDTYYEDNSQGRPRPCICWPDGATLGMGWASHMGGDPGGFKVLGFTGYTDFYSLPKEKRNEFLENGRKLLQKIMSEVIKDKRIRNKEKLQEMKLIKLLTGLKALARRYKKFKRETPYDKKPRKKDYYDNSLNAMIKNL